MKKSSSAITNSAKREIFEWAQTDNLPTVLPRSKTQRLALQSKLANIDAEKAIARAYQAELLRTKAVGEAMLKSGKALRYSLTSSGRQIFLRTEAARRQFEPGYRTN